MENNTKVKVAITHGDTNGIGYELIFKTFSDLGMLELCTPIIYGSPKVATYYRNLLKIQANFKIITDAKDAEEGTVNFLACVEDEIKVEPRVASEASGVAALQALDRALDDYRNGLYDVLVTAPIENTDAFHFSGQSRYIEDHMETDSEGLTLLVSNNIRVALATRNLPLKQVCESITQAGIEDKCRTLLKVLRRDFRISNPRIAVLSLNPKAGDNGLLGSEEQEVIQPAVAQLVSEEAQVFGPYAPDEFFGDNLMEHFDVVLAMYYDQGMVPFRTLSTEACVNYSAGLPLVRTAPALTEALSIAGKGIADEQALRQAIFTAIDIYRNRNEYDEAVANPLPKLYRERRDESDKVRFAMPKRRDDANNNNRK